MAIQRLALAALSSLLASSTLAAPALAAPTLAQWIEAIDRAGVQHRIDPNCDRWTLATYRWPERAIYLCNAAFRGSHQELLGTIAHEAVHAAQHCLALAHGRSGLMPFTIGMRSWDRRQADIHEAAIRADLASRNDTRAGDDLAEIEAYSWEKDPDMAIRMLNWACKR